MVIAGHRLLRTSLAAILWVALAAAPPLPGQNDAPFTGVGDMVHVRGYHTATLLFDGRVLIAGGGVEQAELYDPATATFSPTGSLPQGHRSESAALLPNGKVLILGRNRLGSSTANLYDPATGMFSPTGIPQQQMGKTTLLPNGKVMLNGGYAKAPIARAELYDTATGNFSYAGEYVVPFSAPNLNPNEGYGGAGTALLANGKVLIASWPSIEVYDPFTDSFSLGGAMLGGRSILGYGGNTAMYGRTATLLPDGRMLLAGGTVLSWGDDWGQSLDAEVYDPASDESLATQSMWAARLFHQSVLLPDGKVFIAGGVLDPFNVVSTAFTELYDPLLDIFGTAGNMTVPRAGSVTLLNDGSVLLTGGEIPTLYPGELKGRTAEVYRPPQAVPPPVMLTVTVNGQDTAAIQHADYQMVSASNPVTAGEYLLLYVTGLAEGSVIPPQVVFGGEMAEVTYFGNHALYPGLGQINIRVPAGIAAGDAAPIRLLYRGRISNEVTVPVR